MCKLSAVACHPSAVCQSDPGEVQAVGVLQTGCWGAVVYSESGRSLPVSGQHSVCWKAAGPQAESTVRQLLISCDRIASWELRCAWLHALLRTRLELIGCFSFTP